MAAAAVECSYLPYELWERIIKFLNDDPCTFKSLYVVSKQFLSITNHLRFSVTIKHERIRFSPRLFQRFPNLTSLNLILSCNRNDFDLILTKISDYHILSNIKSLSLSNPNSDIPAEGLQALSKKMTNLTSLTCSKMLFLGKYDLFLIADCFPLLEELDLSYPLYPNLSTFYFGIHSDQPLVLPKLRKINLSGNLIGNHAVVYLFMNCILLQEMTHSMNDDDDDDIIEL